MFDYLLRLFNGRRTEQGYSKPKYQAERVEETPDILDKFTVYLVGSKKSIWHAEMICPCGCGAVLSMNLQNDFRPCWRATVFRDKTISLYPSVWRKVGCKSHFILRRGAVRWCREFDD